MKPSNVVITGGTSGIGCARMSAGGFGAKLFDKAAAAAHLGMVSGRDVAELIVFLTNPSAARMTGQVISVNGGISAGSVTSTPIAVVKNAALCSSRCASLVDRLLHNLTSLPSVDRGMSPVMT